MNKIMLLLAGFVFSFSAFADDYKVTVKNMQEQSASLGYSISAKYPQLTGNLGESEKAYNIAAEKWVNNRIADFKKSLRELDTSRLPSEIKKRGSNLDINFKLTAFIPHVVVSQLNHVDVNYAGSAHPNQELSSINYDLKNNKLLALGDLFKPDSNYLAKIAQYSESQLQPKLQNGMFKEGFAPNDKNYRVWNMIPKGLSFIFNNYQVAPYVYGPQQVVIPNREINDMLLDQSVFQDFQHMQRR